MWGQLLLDALHLLGRQGDEVGKRTHHADRGVVRSDLLSNKNIALHILLLLEEPAGDHYVCSRRYFTLFCLRECIIERNSEAKTGWAAGWAAGRGGGGEGRGKHIHFRGCSTSQHHQGF